MQLHTHTYTHTHTQLSEPTAYVDEDGRRKLKATSAQIFVLLAGNALVLVVRVCVRECGFVCVCVHAWNSVYVRVCVREKETLSSSGCVHISFFCTCVCVRTRTRMDECHDV